MKQILEEIIKEWWNQKLPKIYRREVNLLDFFDEKVKKIVSVIGFRRIGKTYSLLDLAQKLGPENCIYVNFEDERIPEKTEILTLFLETVKELRGNKKTILLLDEIQNIPKWSKWVRRTIDTCNYPIFLSGSSSKLSSREIPTELRGRGITRYFFPLSFREFLVFKNKKVKDLPQSAILRLQREYLEFGGLPEVVLSEEGKKYFLIDEYFKTFLIRDIFERYNPRNEAAIRDMVKLLLNSTHFTISKLTNTLKSLGYKIGKGTISNYLSWIESSFFVYFVKFYSPNVKNQLQYPRKPYFVDNFFIKRFSSKFSKNLGRLMENLVAQDLIRKVLRDFSLEIYYWQNNRNQEVDFVLKNQTEIEQLIQVCYNLSDPETRNREINSLLEASRKLKCNNLLIINSDYENEERIEDKKVKFVPLWKWLLR